MIYINLLNWRQVERERLVSQFIKRFMFSLVLVVVCVILRSHIVFANTQDLRKQINEFKHFNSSGFKQIDNIPTLINNQLRLNKKISRINELLSNQNNLLALLALVTNDYPGMLFWHIDINQTNIKIKAQSSQQSQGLVLYQSLLKFPRLCDIHLTPDRNNQRSLTSFDTFVLTAQMCIKQPL